MAAFFLVYYMPLESCQKRTFLSLGRLLAWEVEGPGGLPLAAVIDLARPATSHVTPGKPDADCLYPTLP
jgi:hypothetical protein